MKYTEREQNGSNVIIWDEIEDDFNLKMTKTHNLHIKWINFLFNGSFLCRNYLMLFLTMKNSKFSSVFLNSTCTPSGSPTAATQEEPTIEWEQPWEKEEFEERDGNGSSNDEDDDIAESSSEEELGDDEDNEAQGEKNPKKPKKKKEKCMPEHKVQSFHGPKRRKSKQQTRQKVKTESWHQDPEQRAAGDAFAGAGGVATREGGGSCRS